MSLNQKHPKEWFNKPRGVQVQRIPLETDEWFEFRNSGLGGTDVGRVLGLNDWEGGSAIECFYEKTGLKPVNRNTNNFTYWGKDLESRVANAWKYYDGKSDGYISNFNEGKQLRDCRNLSGFFTNTKYPHLFCSIDRMINKGSFNLLDGTLLEDNGILECKTASTWTTKKWIDGLDVNYVVQVQQQLMVLALEYAEVAMLELDARKFYVFPTKRDHKTCDQIDSETGNFWNLMILPARKLAAQYLLENERGNLNECKKIMAEIQQYEPAADASQRYKDFQNERWLSEPTIVKGEPQHILNAFELKYFKEIEKIIQPEIFLRENRVREVLEANEKLDLDPYGAITWKSQGSAGGKQSRVMRIASFSGDVMADVQKAFEKILSHIPVR